AFFLVLKSLRINIGYLININRLIKLTQISAIKNDELCLLIAICDLLAKEVDFNFSQIRKKLYKKNLKMLEPPKSETDDYLIKKWGSETSLEDFGVKVRKFYDESEKKLMSFKKLCEFNPWLKYRAIIGPNTRADVLYLKATNQNQSTALVAAKAFC